METSLDLISASSCYLSFVDGVLSINFVNYYKIIIIIYNTYYNNYKYANACKYESAKSSFFLLLLKNDKF